MTKNEIVHAILTDKRVPFIQRDQLERIVNYAVDQVVENYKTTLPSELDEAAEKIASDIEPDYPDISADTCHKKIVEGIKAGAEWMTNQGFSISTELKVMPTGEKSPEGEDEYLIYFDYDEDLMNVIRDRIRDIISEDYGPGKNNYKITIQFRL